MAKRSVNFGFGMPSDMQEAWQWVIALDAWDYCNPNLLSELVSSEPPPESIRPILASIINGDRKPKVKAASKLKIPVEERMKIAGTVSCVLGLIDCMKYDAYDSDNPSAGKGVSEIAYRKGVEPVDVKRELEKSASDCLMKVAHDLDVSVETIENLLRDLRNKIKNWPYI